MTPHSKENGGPLIPSKYRKLWARKQLSWVVNYLSEIDHNFDIYAFLGIWFKSGDDFKLIDIDNYSKLYCIRYVRVGGGASLSIHLKHNYILSQVRL